MFGICPSLKELEVGNVEVETEQMNEVAQLNGRRNEQACTLGRTSSLTGPQRSICFYSGLATTRVRASNTQGDGYAEISSIMRGRVETKATQT